MEERHGPPGQENSTSVPVAQKRLFWTLASVKAVSIMTEPGRYSRRRCGTSGARQKNLKLAGEGDGDCAASGGGDGRVGVLARSSGQVLNLSFLFSLLGM